MALTVAESKVKKGTNIQASALDFTEMQRFKFTLTSVPTVAEVVENDNKELEIKYEAIVYSDKKGIDDNYYLMQSENYTGKISGYPLACVKNNFRISIKSCQ